MENLRRDMNFQTVGWFWDLNNRALLILNPPYQRRSVWNQDYKDYFIDTVLHGYPAPAIFLFRETSPEGVSKYSVVDGKQRLSTLFEFAKNNFAVSERASISRLRGKYFKDLPDEVKTNFWNYRFAVENLPSDNEEVINNIFDRINRNVARLTAQELRHAQFSGAFISSVEDLTEWVFKIMPQGIPNITTQSRKQMKGDEFISQLLLLIEEGPRNYSIEELDRAFADRDTNWELQESITSRFREIVEFLVVLAQNERGAPLFRSRLKFQADFYSLFGAIHELLSSQELPSVPDSLTRLDGFVKLVENPDTRTKNPIIAAYYDATRSSSNDTGARRTRIDIIKNVLKNAHIESR
jgi:hypothetical protein